MSQTAETKPGLTRKQWIIALLLGFLLLGSIAAGTAYVLRPPKPQADLTDLNDDDLLPVGPTASTGPAGTAATQAAPVRRRPRPIALTEADGVYKRSDTKMELIAKSAVMAVTTLGENKFTFAYSYRPTHGSDSLYWLLTRIAQDPAAYPEVKLTNDQIARITAISTAWVLPETDKPVLEDLFRTYAAAPDGPGKDTAKIDVLSALGTAGEKAATDLQLRQVARVTVMSSDQINQCRAILRNGKPRPRTVPAAGPAPAPAPAPNANLP